MVNLMCELPGHSGKSARYPLNKNLKCQVDPVLILMFMSKVHFNIVLRHMARPPKWAVFFKCTSGGIRKSI